MDRRLLFPAVVATAWAQQTSPEAAEAEKALRARAEKFYQLEVARNFRAAWALVADDTQDYFFNGGRNDITGFTIDKIELLENNKYARMTIKAKAVMRAPGLTAIDVEVPIVSTWKLENGDWYWYVDQSGGVDTPFGKIATANDAAGGPKPSLPGIPSVAAMKSQVSIDKQAVVLSAEAPVQTVEISNHMPGPITVDIQSQGIDGLIVEVDNKQVASQKSGTVSFRAKPGAKPAGKVGIDVAPLGQHFEVMVSSQ
jgi:hypothetical protein